MVLEARDRVGGRTLSVPVGADAVDLGGQWVGPAQPNCLELINELKLATVKQQWFDEPAAGANNFSSGSSVPLTEEEDRELEAIAAQLEGWAESVLDPASWAVSPHAAKWDTLSVAQFFDGAVKSAVVRRELDLLVRTVTASEPHDLSFLYFLFFLGVCGGLAGVGDGDGGAQSFKLPCGAQQLSLGMMQELEAQGVHVRLNTPVTAVSRTGGIVTLASAGGEVLVEASCLVVAVSPPLWSTITWSPALSPAKQDAAARMYMGSAVKTITVYRECFWQPFKPQGQLEELGPVANLFPTTVDGAPALVGLVTAGMARTFAVLQEEERRVQVLAQYQKYFGSAKALECVAFHSKDWINETYSRGCYAALMPPRLATGCGSVLRAPEGRVCFAGTELATSWPGYFEGALDAGYRAAGEVVALLSQ